jgi:exosortase/archaeosortase family protein
MYKEYSFYVLLLIPLIWYLLEDRQWPSYGVAALFIIFLKGEGLSIRFARKSGILGVLLAATSFLTPLLKPFIGVDARFTSLEYAVYVAGLMIIFYGFSSLRRFLVALGFLFSVSLFLHFSAAIEGLFARLIPALMYVVTGMLGFSGLSSSLSGDVFSVHGPNSFVVRIVPSCAGIQSSFIFGTVIAIMFSELKASSHSKIGFTGIGFLGTLFVNCIRIYLICLLGVYTSLQITDLFHSVAGYLLFIPWILIVEYVTMRRYGLSEEE